MAKVSVKEVMQLPALRGAQIVAGDGGLIRDVLSVNVMEVPDVEAFVRSGDLLLTTAYPVHHDPSILVRLVRYFHERGLAALAIKKGRYLKQWPDGLVEICNELNFPLIALRDDLSFDEVIGEVMAIVLSEYGPEPSRADAIRQQLTEVALSGGGLEDIARTLADALGCMVTIVDLEGNTLATTSNQLGRNVSTVQVDRTECKEMFDITVAAIRKGFICVHTEDPLTIGQRRLIQQACFAAGMHIAQQQAMVEVNRRLRTLALEEIVRGTDLSQSRHQHLFDWHLENLDTVVIVSSAKTLPNTYDVRRIWGKSALAWMRGDDVIVLCGRMENPSGPKEAATIFSELFPKDAHLGIGDSVENPAEIPHSHNTALEALRIASLTNRKVGLYEELEMELLLLSLERSQVERFVERQIGPLISYDQEHDGALVETLRQVLGTGNGSEASRRLFIHYNTLKYRLEQIRDLIGDNWDTPESRISLLLALQLEKLRD